ncbi:MAG: HAD family hydrolase [Clostridia bacterium]|nr:HAD family hydrolase [Clostridia bacterium]
MRYKYILFDLDGTLTDPVIGITKSVAHALKKMKNIEVELEELTKFIGPPLLDSFIDFYGFSEVEAKQAIECYREYFKDEGIYENEIYDGIKAMLEKLDLEGKEMAVATSKPTVFAERIIDYFGLNQYFKVVLGSHLDGGRTKKSEVIEAVLEELEIQDLKEVVMIGDRKHDIMGAKHTGIDSIGVEYGYGSYEELESAGADFIACNVSELSKILLNH